MGPAPTPWSAIDAWARRYGVEGEEFEALVHGIRMLDTALLEHHDKQAEKDRERKR